MNYQPSDQQIDELTAAVGRQVFQKLGVRASADTRYLAIRIAGSDAMQSIIRAAQAQAWEAGHQAGVDYEASFQMRHWDSVEQASVHQNPYRESADV